MKLSHSISLIALTLIASSAPALAQDARPGNRFNYAVNTWRQESAPVRHAAPDPVHNVRSGMVPGGNPLGLDPVLLAKPAPPPVQLPALPPRQVTPTVTATAHVPNTFFQPSFGKPAETAPQAAMPQKLAQMPAPMQAAPQMSKPVAAAPAAPVRSGYRSASRVSCRMRPFAHTTPLMAKPQVATYNGAGYAPGAYLPSGSSDSSNSASARLSGKILTRTRH